MSVVNLYKTVCPQCGVPTDGLMSGNIFHTTLPSGQLIYAKHNEKNQARNFLVKQGVLSEFANLNWVSVAAGERVPGKEMCEKCVDHTKRITHMQQEVEAGGVAWRCEECGSADVVDRDHEMSIRIREESGIKAPDICALNYMQCSDHEEAGIEKCTSCGKVTMIVEDGICGDCFELLDSNDEPA